jgi:hypothetical protein
MNRWHDAANRSVAPIPERPWARSLLAGGAWRVETVRDERDASELIEACCAEQTNVRPVGAGIDGVVSPTLARAGGVLVDAANLSSDAAADVTSTTVTLPAGMTWAVAHAFALRHGLSLSDITDAFGDATIGGTLGRQPWLPARWNAGTARSRCIGLTAIGPDGRSYAYRPAPRTASGPDLRALWFGAEGRAGLMVSVTLAAMLESRAASYWLLQADAERLRAVASLLQRFATCLRVIPTPRARTIRVRVRGDRAETQRVLDLLGALGARSHAELRSERPSAARWSVLPLDEAAALWSDGGRRGSMYVLGMGPTHVVTAWSARDRGLRIPEAARGLAATGPLGAGWHDAHSPGAKEKA